MTRKTISFIWSKWWQDLLRGEKVLVYRCRNQYKDVMLPLTVLRRLDCVLASSKDKVLQAAEKWSEKGARVLRRETEAGRRP
jgi:type I restriction enzyme M protein